MVLFVLISAALCLIAAALIARPLLRRMEAPPALAEHGQLVYRDQLRELERDAARGLLSPEEIAAARAEIGRRMLAAERDAARAQAAPARPVRLMAISAVLIPLAAIALYLTIGRPGAPDRPLAPRLEAGERGVTDPQLANAIAEYAARVRRDPNDADSRIMLARLFYRSGQYDSALEHFAAGFGPEPEGAEPAVLVEYAQARVLAGDGMVDSEAFNLFRRVVDSDPRNAEARFWLGQALFQYGEPALAHRMWSGLLPDLPPDSPIANVVRQQLAALEQMGVGVRPQAPAVPGAQPADPLPDLDELGVLPDPAPLPLPDAEPEPAPQ